MSNPTPRTNERAVRVTDAGDTKVMVGVAVCQGPKTFRLLLTHPHQAEGRIVEIPHDRIDSIDDVEPSPRGASPSIVES